MSSTTLSIESIPSCPFCKRPLVRNMRHHPIPRSRGGTLKIDCCRDCHKAAHLCFTLKEMEQHFHTVGRLLTRAKFRKMVGHIKRQNPHHKVRMLKPLGATRKRY